MGKSKYTAGGEGDGGGPLSEGQDTPGFQGADGPNGLGDAPKSVADNAKGANPKPEDRNALTNRANEFPEGTDAAAGGRTADERRFPAQYDSEELRRQQLDGQKGPGAFERRESGLPEGKPLTIEAIKDEFRSRYGFQTHRHATLDLVLNALESALKSLASHGEIFSLIRGKADSPQEWPKMYEHAELGQLVVNSEEHAGQLTEGWKPTTPKEPTDADKERALAAIPARPNEDAQRPGDIPLLGQGEDGKPALVEGAK